MVLNKIDLLSPDDVDQFCQDIVSRLNWKGKVFRVSGICKNRFGRFSKEAMQYLEEHGGKAAKEDWED